MNPRISEGWKETPRGICLYSCRDRDTVDMTGRVFSLHRNRKEVEYKLFRYPT